MESGSSGRLDPLLGEIESLIEVMQLIIQESGDPRVCEVLMKEIRLLRIYVGFLRVQTVLGRQCRNFGRWLFDDLKEI